MPNTFSVRNGLKQGDSLLPLVLKFALQYAIRMVQKQTKGC
jgi:hypothetical protein